MLCLVDIVMKLIRAFVFAACIAAGAVVFLLYNQASPSDTLVFTSYPKRVVHDKKMHDVYFAARDGKQLFYRFLPHGHAEQLIVLLHGSTYHGSYLTPLAEHLQLCGDICIPDLRGHGKSAPPAGTCSYIGQLEDDLADLIKHLQKDYKKIVLIGHSSGGGFAIRFASGKNKKLVQSLILLSPAIVTAPTMNTAGARSWAHPKMIKVGELLALNALGITRFNTTPVITFNKPPEYCDGTETLTYDYNLMVSLHPRIPYKKDLEAVASRSVVLVGEEDEINKPHAFELLFPKASVTRIPGCRHLDIVENKQVIEKIKKLLS